MKTFALIGNPNSGKTTLFNTLTGSSMRVGNWPGVTVDKKEGICKLGKEEVMIIDLPGIYSLSPYTSEEVISRNYLLNEKVDCIINIIDSTNLERNLYLTTQLLEMDIPIVIALNMVDLLEKLNKTIDPKIIEEGLNVKTYPLSALKEEGVEELINLAIDASLTPRRGESILKNNKIYPLISELTFNSKFQNHKAFHALKLIENDEIEVKNNKEGLRIIEEFKANFDSGNFKDDLEAYVADARYKFICQNLNALKLKGDTQKKDITSKIDKVLTHKILAIPCFLIIMLLVFHLTFSENFLFFGKYLNNGEGLLSFEGSAFEGLLADGGISSPGVILFKLVEILTTFLTDKLTLLCKPLTPWVSGLIADGVFGGIFAVFSFLPQILCLFLFFSILEDSGYMARVAFILDRMFRKLGLTGRAFLPLFMGFGCSVPAMVNTRTLNDEKERLATIRVIPFFSCGAKLPILTAISGAMATVFGFKNADLITYGMYLLGIVSAIVCLLIMKHTMQKKEAAPFIMELPMYHLPKFKSLCKLLWEKIKHFIKKAFTIILASTIIIWVISHFSFSFKYLEDEMMNLSILAQVGRFFQPIFTPLGFGSQLNEYGWVFIVGAITGLIAKENVIASFGTLGACIALASGNYFEANEAMEGVDSVIQMISATGITSAGLLAYIAFNMLTIPCFAAVATSKSELSKKGFYSTLLFWIVASFVISALVYGISSLFIAIKAFALLVLLAIIAIIVLLDLFIVKKVIRSAVND